MLAVLLVQKRGGEPQLYRGTNMEVGGRSTPKRSRWRPLVDVACGIPCPLVATTLLAILYCFRNFVILFQSNHVFPAPCRMCDTVRYLRK